MKMYLICANVDTYTGIRLAGVDGVVVNERDELKKALEDVASEMTGGVVYLSERYGREVTGSMETFALEWLLPLLV